MIAKAENGGLRLHYDIEDAKDFIEEIAVLMENKILQGWTPIKQMYQGIMDKVDIVGKISPELVSNISRPVVYDSSTYSIFNNPRLLPGNVPLQSSSSQVPDKDFRLVAPEPVNPEPDNPEPDNPEPDNSEPVNSGAFKGRLFGALRFYPFQRIL